MIEDLVAHLDRDGYRKEFVAATRAERERLSRGDERKVPEWQLKMVKEKVGRTVMAINTMAYAEALTEALAKLEEEKRRIESHVSKLARQAPAMASDAEIESLLAIRFGA